MHSQVFCCVFQSIGKMVDFFSINSKNSESFGFHKLEQAFVLWKDNNNGSTGIMEVQHRRGSSMEMHKLRLRLNKAVMLGTVADRAMVSTHSFNEQLPLRPSLKRISRTLELPQNSEGGFPRYTKFHEICRTSFP